MVCAEGVFGAVGYAEGGSVGEGWGGLTDVGDRGREVVRERC